MWRLLRFIFTGDGHLHQWEVIASGEIISNYPSGRKSVTGHFYTMRCKHCGKHREDRV